MSPIMEDFREINFDAFTLNVFCKKKKKKKIESFNVEWRKWKRLHLTEWSSEMMQNEYEPWKTFILQKD